MTARRTRSRQRSALHPVGRAWHLLEHLGDPDRRGPPLDLELAALATDVEDYARTLWSGDSLAYPVDSFYLPEYLKAFRAMLPRLRGCLGITPPFELARAQQRFGGQPVVKPAMQFEDQVAGASAAYRDIWLRRFSEPGNEAEGSLMLPEWPDLFRLLVTRTTDVAFHLSGKATGFAARPSVMPHGVAACLFVESRECSQNALISLLDLELEFESVGGRLKVTRGAAGIVELYAVIPYPPICEEQSHQGSWRLRHLVVPLELETDALLQVEPGSGAVSGLLVATTTTAFRGRTGTQDDRTDASLVDAVRRAVEHRLLAGKKITLTEIARAIPRPSSARTLQRKLAALRLTFKADFVNPARLDYAARLLADDHSVKHVCRVVGYADPSLFARQFAKRFGIAPRGYRRRETSRRRLETRQRP